MAQTAPPPRSLNDVTTVIDREKPDTARKERSRAAAEVVLSPDASAQAYYQRAQARAAIGRNRDAIADAEQAIRIGGDYVRDVSRYQQFLAGQYRVVGDLKRSIAIDEEISKKFEEIGRNKGRFFSSNLRSTLSYLGLGDVRQAEVFVAKNAALLAEARKWKNFDVTGPYFEAQVENGRARVLTARGKYREAELSYDKAQKLYERSIANIPRWPGNNPPTKEGIQSTVSFLLAFEGQTKERQGRLTEGEADIRRALLDMMQASGKYSPDVAQVVTMLANTVGQQRRWGDAEKLARTALDIYAQIGTPHEAPIYARALNQLATTLNAQNRYEDAEEVYGQVDEAIKRWEPERADGIRQSWSRIFNSYYTRNVDAGVELARQALARVQKRVGDSHIDTANARAVLAVGLTFARKDDEALKEFQLAMPALLAVSRDTEDDDVAVSAAADSRDQTVIEAYLGLLSRNRRAVPNVASESFRLGERIRGHSVEKALSASSARAMSDATLAGLARREQDLQKAIGANLGTVNNLQALPPGERDEKEIASLRANVDKLRAERVALRQQIEKLFPGYADLVAPKPATVEDIRAILRPGEVFLSFYFGRRMGFVWAIPKDGEIGYASIALNQRQLSQTVMKLREALEPQASSVGDIPSFDLALAHQLYLQLLKPVDAVWKPSKNIIMVTNGALGLLPLGVLPIEPKSIDKDSQPIFGAYREVAWLARTHAITSVPSAAAFRTLRKLPAGKIHRDTFIAFGDPLFNSEQAAEWRGARDAARQGAAPVQTAQLTTRGLPLVRRAAPQFENKESVTISALPRLSDTADELKAIALALEADPSKVLYLGTEANERKVKTTDLSKFKIIAFATHGLVPGELDGLTQPALALSAPNVADVDGDGLLTMEEILGLKLDADWVVLSACNTGTSAGTGAGAEAASGLGRAFFYAGTRALLVTNWSVHSASARELVTDLFRRQAQDSKLTRGEALRQAMMALVDGPGFKDDGGKTLFSYAHPLFWAPYTIIGDGGGN